MIIMSINCGSSCLKFKLFEMPEEKVITEGIFERIGFKDQGTYKIKINGKKETYEIPLENHQVAVNILLKDLVEKKIISSLDEIKGVGHRIVQGGTYFTESVVLDDYAKGKIEELIDLAPLHNGPNLVGVKAFEDALKGVKQVGVFDTAFHNKGMAEEAYMYAIPYEWYKKYGIRKYGAHGTSHMYVSNEYAKLKGKDIKDLKIITCHIGNGVSICAIDKGLSKDTSMGLTPLEGVPMGTRSGNVDPSIVSYIAEKENKTAKEVVNMLNKKSGYLGISEISHDSRDIEDAYMEGNARAALTINVQVKRIVDYIASYYVYMGGCDAIIFTAGLGENSNIMRELIAKRLSCLGVVLDEKANMDRGHVFKLSKDESKIELYVIPTNEELVIARDTYNLI